MSRHPLTAAALLANAQEGLHLLDLQNQAVADQVAEDLRELFRLRQVRLTRPALLGFVVGVADLTRLRDELGTFTHEDIATCQAMRNDLLLGVARLAQASTSPRWPRPALGGIRRLSRHEPPSPRYMGAY